LPPETRHLLVFAKLLRSGADVLLLENLLGTLGAEAYSSVKTALTQICAQGYAIVLAEQDLDLAKMIARHSYVMKEGRIVNRLYSDVNHAPGSASVF